MTSSATYTPEYTRWRFETWDGVIEFQWNRSKTVNVYINDENTDVWTYQATPELGEVLGDINGWLRDRFDKPQP